jgi:hypothetical protein
MSEKKSSTVRRRVCRVAASVTIAGQQDASVQIGIATTGEPAIAVRIGTLLIYVEDTKALTSLVEAIVGASAVGDRIFGEDRAADTRRAAAWKAMHSRNRHYA